MDDKPLLIETILIQNKRVRHIKYHNHRCNSSRKSLFGSNQKIDLRKYIDTSQATNARTKCRITYDDKVRKVEYEPYSIRPIHSLKFIEIGDYEYAFKYADRYQLMHFFNQRGEKDDILMIRSGLITDTLYANVALQKDDIWYTPKKPLLKGTRRARLIESKTIIPMDIHKDQINEFTCISIFNALIPFKKVVVKI